MILQIHKFNHNTETQVAKVQVRQAVDTHFDKMIARGYEIRHLAKVKI